MEMQLDLKRKGEDFPSQSISKRKRDSSLPSPTGINIVSSAKLVTQLSRNYEGPLLECSRIGKSESILCSV